MRVASTAAAVDRLPARRWLQAILAIHVVAWTLVPALVHTGLPQDLVEAYAIGREWVIGFHKHPALPFWLLEGSRAVTGAVGWPAYLLASLCVTATMWLVHLLARDMLDETRAAAATLLLSGVMYFNWVTPEFNHNVAHMPAWMAVILALWRARERGTAVWWLALGLAAAAATYVKLSSAILLAVAAAYILADRRCRRALSTPLPWLGLALYLVLIAPLAVHLLATEFAMLAYAEARALQKSDGALVFFGKQLLSVLVLFAIALVAVLPLQHAPEPDDQRSLDALRFTLVMHAAPVAVLMLGATAAGAGLKGSWGSAMASLNGLVIMLLARHFGILFRAARVVVAAALLTVIVPVAYAVVVVGLDTMERTPQRVSWPQREIAVRFEAAWLSETGAPLRIVAGDVWTAGQIAVHAASRPSLFIDASRARSPWITDRRLEQEGALVVWWWPGGPPKQLAPLVAGRTAKQLHFSLPVDRLSLNPKTYTLDLTYVVVPPRPAIAR
jgi:hypothetical protein